MGNAVAVTVEGVIQKYVSYAPISSGIALYHGLCSSFNVILLSDTMDREELTAWLDLEGLFRHGLLVCSDPVLEQQTCSERRISQCAGLRARGFYIDFVIEPDPQVAANLLSSGYSVMNFLHSLYALPQWRPDFEGPEKTWMHLKLAANKNMTLRAQDMRLKKEDE